MGIDKGFTFKDRSGRFLILLCHSVKEFRRTMAQIVNFFKSIPYMIAGEDELTPIESYKVTNALEMGKQGAEGVPKLPNLTREQVIQALKEEKAYQQQVKDNQDRDFVGIRVLDTPPMSPAVIDIPKVLPPRRRSSVYDDFSRSINVRKSGGRRRKVSNRRRSKAKTRSRRSRSKKKASRRH